jgi:hypothetical protein
MRAIKVTAAENAGLRVCHGLFGLARVIRDGHVQ